MSILNIRKLTHGFGAKPLIESGNLVISKGDKVCLVGRNGMGKSTLLKILAGDIEPDDGVIEKDSGLKISMLQQAVPKGEDQLVYDIIENNQAHLEPHQINKIISKLNLDGYALFSSLSGGLKRRVLLAQA